MRPQVDDELRIRSDRLEVSMWPGKGADIVEIVDRASGVDFMFRSPWRGRAHCLTASSSMERWIERYPGGWQLLLPNGGAECVEGGVTWGYHGEAAVVPWEVTASAPDHAELETHLFSVPVHVRREIMVEDRLLRVTETVTNESDVELEVMWSHHPAFGAPFLEGGCVLSAGCREVVADDLAPGTLVAGGSRHEWPFVTSVDGERVDLRIVPPPSEPRALLAYLRDFEEGFFAICNPRLRLGIGFRWPLQIFDKAWLWQEVRSGQGWPWYRRAYVVAVEPASTVPGQGMASARRHGEPGVLLAAGTSKEVVVEAVVFEGSGEVAGIGAGGAVRFV